MTPSVYFNVSKGFEELLPYLREDKALCTHFFSNLKMFFYAGSGMPQHVWDALEQIAYDTTGSSTLIKRALFADFDLSIDKGEITDKGTINQRQILANWPNYVEEIYDKLLENTVLGT